jgi:DNA-binding NtrC family response regulator
MNTTSVWIVHKTLHMLMLMRNALYSQGYPNVRCFTHSEEVLALIRQGMRPDVVIAEDGLPGASGNDLLSLICSLCATCSGILLVSPDANPYASRHHAVVEGAPGFHESLVQMLELITVDGYQALGAAAASTEPIYANGY